ncbi:hypothetical protein QNH16_13730 [Peribacillus frigoritolerans]|uniref:hypothetical protein n=1 Tax=Peribacillus frigoritolerans TaxID=450367 RepID=UPI0024BF883C|nr:hypothetical protein [Peribacillus frigoritolerans]WHY11891.1 hypothetical protein QNH16_13730 [Peribacillus frigoritolerans]
MKIKNEAEYQYSASFEDTEFKQILTKGNYDVVLITSDSGALPRFEISDIKEKN